MKIHLKNSPNTGHVTQSALGRTFATALEKRSDGDDGGAESWALALLSDALEGRATDIHLDPHGENLHVRFRIDGAIHPVRTVPTGAGQRLVGFFKVASSLDPAPSLAPEDARIHQDLGGTELDVRLSCAPCVSGDKIALRILRKTAAMSLGDLGFRCDDRDRVRGWLDDMSGMLVVAGPVGSGKTTTLYALLGELNPAETNIVTIEDPVEYQMEHINQMEVSTKRGLTFEKGMSAVLRLDPDYVLLGEIRDAESTRTAMGAARAGRVVLTTMHSRNSAGVVTALRGLGIPNHEIAASLAFVVAQRLVRKLCVHCREEGAPTDAERRWLESLGEEIPETAWHSPGCEKCGGFGYHGRTGIFETLPVDEEAYRKILADEDEHRLRRHLREAGFRPLIQDGLEKAREGITGISELGRIGAQSYLERAMRDDG